MVKEVRDLYKCSHISFHSVWNDATSWSWSELGEPSFRSSYTKGKDWKICCQFNLRYFYVGLSTLISTPYIAWLYEGILIFSVMYIIYLLICVSGANVLLIQHQPGVGKFKRGDTYFVCECSGCLRHSTSDQRDWERVLCGTFMLPCFYCFTSETAMKKENKIFNYPILKTECVNVWARVLVNSYCIHLISYVKHIVFWKVLNSQGVKTRNRDCRFMQQNVWTITKEKNGHETCARVWMLGLYFPPLLKDIVLN